MVLPGGPSAKCRREGHQIEPGDVVVGIDGVAVDKQTIVEKLRGCDLPGSSVAVTVQKRQSKGVLSLPS